LEGELRSSPEGEVRWFQKSELCGLNLIPSDRAMLNSVFYDAKPFAKRSLLRVESDGKIELAVYGDILSPLVVAKNPSFVRWNGV